MTTGSDNAAMLTQCLEFCQALESKGQQFSFSFSLGTSFNFSLKRWENQPIKLVEKRKKKSPSTIKRNMKRKEEYMRKKAETEEESSLQKKPIPCDQCDNVFRTETGLKIHVGQTHKKEIMRSSSPAPSLKVSPEKGANREEQEVTQCGNCNGPFTPDHTCSMDCDLCDETFTTEDKLGRHRACVHSRCACSACDNTDPRPLDFHRCFN